MQLSTSAITGIAVAAGCGLLIGVERERRKGRGPARAFAGVRSFTLAALCGALAQALGGGLVWVSGLLVACLVATAYWRDRSSDPGITTELALFLCFLLGVAAIDQPALVAGAGAAIAVLLHWRDPLHRFVRVTLTEAELRDGLLFAGAALIVLPLLPAAEMQWLPGINLRTVWTLVIVIMGIQAVAHVALRLAGAQLGLAVSGLAGGFISSVATIAAMGARARKEPGLLGACVAAALASSIATFALLWVVALTVAPAQLVHVAPSLGSASAAILLAAGFGMSRQRPGAYMPPGGHVFDLRQALVFATLFSMGAAGLSYLNAQLGPQAFLGGAALAGFFDVHAAAASALTLLATNAAPPHDVLLAVLLAITSNTLSKAGAALAGGWRFALPVIAGLLLALAAAWLPFCLMTQ